jgi:hypothetical protein
MTRAQLARLLDELDDHWRLFFEFLAHTGLRILGGDRGALGPGPQAR